MDIMRQGVIIYGSSFSTLDLLATASTAFSRMIRLCRNGGAISYVGEGLQKNE